MYIPWGTRVVYPALKVAVHINLLCMCEWWGITSLNQAGSLIGPSEQSSQAREFGYVNTMTKALPNLCVVA